MSSYVHPPGLEPEVPTEEDQARARFRIRKWTKTVLRGMGVSSPQALRDPPMVIPDFGHDIPSAVDFSRRRPLTPSPILPCHNQAQSGFFSLPPELRIPIYQSLLIGHVFHLIHYSGGIGARHVTLEHVLCSYDEPHRFELFRHPCWGNENVHNVRGEPFINLDRYGSRESPRSKLQAKIMPFLLTCRRMYSDTIDMIYKENIFDMRNLGTLFYLDAVLPPPRFNSLRSLQLNWDTYWIKEDMHAPYDFLTWKRFWSVIASMDGLRSIRCDMEGLISWQSNHIRLLIPLLQVKQVPNFVVEIILPSRDLEHVRAQRDEVLEFAKEAPFTVVERQSDEALKSRRDMWMGGYRIRGKAMKDPLEQRINEVQ